MGKFTNVRRFISRAAVVAALGGFAAACSGGSMGPAPVVLKGSGSNIAGEPGLPQPEPRQITVQHGQTLGAVAHAYHVPERAIIAANHLSPPYGLKEGTRLVIPAAGPAQVQQAMGPSAAAPPGVAQPIPLAPPSPANPAPPPPASAIPPPATTAPPPSASSATLTPPPSAARVLPDIVPLDDAPAAKSAIAAQSSPAAASPSAPAEPAPSLASGPPPVLAPRNPAAALPLPGEEDNGAVATAAGRFPWPVRGHVLTSFGAAPGGGHNDGINIAAPRGTPVRTIDDGTVAYVGNEVRGYGNLVLIKHANGWISAYAHLDEPIVKLGDKVAGGQVIAKVGDSGGVAEPQLHFELRRGKRPVDPREFLAPAPSAANPAVPGAG